jgi:hypothetical protein
MVLHTLTDEQKLDLFAKFQHVIMDGLVEELEDSDYEALGDMTNEQEFNWWSAIFRAISETYFIGEVIDLVNDEGFDSFEYGYREFDD